MADLATEQVKSAVQDIDDLSNEIQRIEEENEVLFNELSGLKKKLNKAKKLYHKALTDYFISTQKENVNA